MNKLFPIHIKLEEIRTLLVGGGPVGLEKIQALVSSSPQARVDVIARQPSQEFCQYIDNRKNIHMEVRDFKDTDVHGHQLVIVASNNPELNQHIRLLCQQRNILLNVADKPSLCDFYLGSVVQKGHLKIGISTNGKSPTIAKRLKELFNEVLPEEIDDTLELMASLRDQLQGSLKEKIEVLNRNTETLIRQRNQNDRAN